MANLHITVKELLSVVAGVTQWDKQWHRKTILARSDNADVVATD